MGKRYLISHLGDTCTTFVHRLSPHRPVVYSRFDHPYNIMAQTAKVKDAPKGVVYIKPSYGRPREAPHKSRARGFKSSRMTDSEAHQYLSSPQQAHYIMGQTSFTSDVEQPKAGLKQANALGKRRKTCTRGKNKENKSVSDKKSATTDSSNETNIVRKLRHILSHGKKCGDSHSQEPVPPNTCSLDEVEHFVSSAGSEEQEVSISRRSTATLILASDSDQTDSCSSSAPLKGILKSASQSRTSMSSLHEDSDIGHCSSPCSSKSGKSSKRVHFTGVDQRVFLCSRNSSPSRLCDDIDYVHEQTSSSRVRNDLSHVGASFGSSFQGQFMADRHSSKHSHLTHYAMPVADSRYEEDVTSFNTPEYTIEMAKRGERDYEFTTHSRHHDEFRTDFTGPTSNGLTLSYGDTHTGHLMRILDVTSRMHAEPQTVRDAVLQREVSSRVKALGGSQKGQRSKQLSEGSAEVDNVSRTDKRCGSVAGLDQRSTRTHCSPCDNKDSRKTLKMVVGTRKDKTSGHRYPSSRQSSEPVSVSTGVMCSHEKAQQILQWLDGIDPCGQPDRTEVKRHQLYGS